MSHSGSGSDPRSPSPGRSAPAHGDPDYVGMHRVSTARRDRAVTRGMVVGAFVLAAALIVVLFFAGTRLGGDTTAAPAGSAGSAGSAAATASPTSTPSPTPAASPAPATGVVPAAPAASGLNSWRALAGGECLTGFTTPWAEEFTVLDCGTEHTAQLVATGVFEGNPTAPYPGEAELASRMNLLCTAPTVLDYAVSGAIPDIQWQAAYPAVDTEWAAGDRRWFCFYSRSSGEAIGASLVAGAAG